MDSDMLNRAEAALPAESEPKLRTRRRELAPALVEMAPAGRPPRSRPKRDWKMLIFTLMKPSSLRNGRALPGHAAGRLLVR